ncbi:hypothetical protein GGX14DRAFT_641147 [Mycena pura]|uniref:Uncharacterized protein n=1 Tax=Mycena pura TaxID=153505 RepID=A0AAD6YQF1_9AGAR|nr:hypothetical protein GGX14DRAFT_641147 [Mycena pura]
MAAQRPPLTPSSSNRTSVLPTPRRPSFTTPGPSSPNTSAPSGFRSLRSLLPFGPNKHASPLTPSAAPPVNGSRFASFSVVRRSINRDRIPSSSSSLSVSDLPVMVIDQTSAVDDSADILVRKSTPLYEFEKSQPSSRPPTPPDLPTPDLLETSQEKAAAEPEVSATEESPVNSTSLRTPSPLPELSTIFEADTSGISKHLPSASPSPSPTSHSPPGLVQDSLSADETSALDLSTTHLDLQVMDALKAQESAAAKNWLDLGDEPSQLVSGPDPGDITFNFGALDPDLAALLSPNRMVPSDTNHTIKAKSFTDLSETPSLSSSDLRAQHQSSRPRLRPIERPLTPATDIATQQSPSASSSSSHTRTGRRPPPSPLSISHPPSPILSSTILPSPLSSSSPATSSTPAPRRTQHSVSASISTLQGTSRRPLLGRMIQTDSWQNTPSSRSVSSRPSLDSVGYRPSSATASRSSLDINRQRPSIDTIRQNNFNDNTNLTREFPSENWSLKFRRTRKRSMSVDERLSPSGSSSPYSESQPESSMASRPEWLGPRTAKAFRAAGLLGSPESESGDGSDSLSAPPAGRSRFGFGSVRRGASVGRSESRMGVASPAPRPGSSTGRRRGSGSGSYFGSAGSQLMESPTLTMSSRDTPRSVSTAPTSVSGASWDRDEIRELKEKHAVETGALLSALSDSQRTTKVLREENSELRERLARLEAEMERMVVFQRENQPLREGGTVLREEAGQFNLRARLEAPVASSSRYVAPAPTQPFLLAPRGGESLRDRDDEDSFNVSAAASRNGRRRLSSSSSNFAAPPSNMSLLLYEDGAHSSDLDERSGASMLASPTIVMARFDSSTSRVHRANKSITSMTSMATSPNASMGSPRSLSLRPEHEVHLQDMDSLDLGQAGPDEDWSE